MTLKVHHLRPAPGAHTAKTRVGRGEGSKGKTAGRGTKGTRRAEQVRPRFEGGQMPLHMRLPKLKGFKNRIRSSTRSSTSTGSPRCSRRAARSTPTSLVEAGAVRARPAGQGARRRATSAAWRSHVTAHAFSASAAEKITAAGGTATAASEHDERPVRTLRALARSTGAARDGRSSACPRLATVSPRRAVANLDSDRRRGGHVLQRVRRGVPDARPRRKLLFTLAIIAIYRLGRVACRRRASRSQASTACLDQAQNGQPARRLLAGQPVLRRRAAAAVGVRARHHAVHHREHHHPAARGGDPAVRAAEEGRASRVRPS